MPMRSESSKTMSGQGPSERELHDLLERNRELLLRRIRLMMGPKAKRKAESGDFLQSVFVEVLQAADRMHGKTDQDLLRWATRIARNNIIDASRRPREKAFSSFTASMTRDRNKLDKAAPNATPSQDAAQREAIEDVVDAMLELPELMQRVLELRDFEKLSFREIGKRLERSENAAQLLHTRALVKLGQHMRTRGG